MTPARWETETRSYLLWQVLDREAPVARTKAGRRKLRLLACAACRLMWELLPDERQRRAVEVSERFADGQATEAELEAARTAAWAAYCAHARRHLRDRS